MSQDLLKTAENAPPVRTAVNGEAKAARPSRFTPEQRAAALAALGESRERDSESILRQFGLEPDDRTDAEIAASAEAALARLKPEIRAQMEREGLI